eukprot:765768-Pelagomonas_calceolata.AAC.11
MPLRSAGTPHLLPAGCFRGIEDMPGPMSLASSPMSYDELVCFSVMLITLSPALLVTSTSNPLLCCTTHE